MLFVQLQHQFVTNLQPQQCGTRTNKYFIHANGKLFREILFVFGLRNSKWQQTNPGTLILSSPDCSDTQHVFIESKHKSRHLHCDAKPSDKSAMDLMNSETCRDELYDFVYRLHLKRLCVWHFNRCEFKIAHTFN